MEIRRVVTGHQDGKAVFAGDEVVPAVDFGGGGGFHLLWGGDGTPHYPDDGAMPEWTSAFPPVGGRRFLLLTLPPEQAGNGSGGGTGGLNEVLTESLSEVMEPDEPGMHTTATIDFEVVLSGEVTLELDDGAEVVLRPFDCVVQNGTRHRWHNRGQEPATMVVFMTGARHDGLGHDSV
jgi:mannose-6-phosphate isomerase-like protein (cupin superfamily)